jgi:hypothetical protein
VKKMTQDGTWHLVEASAEYEEYVATTRDGKPTRMWAEKPRIMLGKCAEALALRKAFPAELSGVYTAEEMDKATVQPEPEPTGRQLMTGAAVRHAVETGTQTTLAGTHEDVVINPKAELRPPAQAAPPPPPPPPAVRSAPAPTTGASASPSSRVATVVVSGSGPPTSDIYPLASPAEVKALNAAITTSLGIRDREEKLKWIGGMLGYAVGSSKDIPSRSVSGLIAAAQAGEVPTDWAGIVGGMIELPPAPRREQPMHEPGWDG